VPSSPKNGRRPPHRVYGPLVGALVGGLCFGLAGACYGTFLHFNPDYKEELIRKRLSEPHMDSLRFLASVQAVRYQGFGEIVLRHAVVPLIVGCAFGAVGGAAFSAWKHKAQTGAFAKEASGGFTFVEFLVVLGIVACLVGLLFPVTGSGLVYYQYQDQYYWLERLQLGSTSEREAAMEALCALLEGKPFPCRSTIIPAIAKCGEDARRAIPVLRTLSSDPEKSVSKAATEALAGLTANGEEDAATQRRDQP
jgi:hypothetical protein